MVFFRIQTLILSDHCYRMCHFFLTWYSWFFLSSRLYVWSFTKLLSGRYFNHKKAGFHRSQNCGVARVARLYSLTYLIIYYCSNKGSSVGGARYLHIIWQALSPINQFVNVAESRPFSDTIVEVLPTIVLILFCPEKLHFFQKLRLLLGILVEYLLVLVFVLYGNPRHYFCHLDWHVARGDLW